MRVDLSTVVLYFVFADCYCKLTVHKKDEAFAREVLGISGVQEWVKPEASKNWHEIDTCMLLDLTRAALPQMLAHRMQKLSAVLMF